MKTLFGGARVALVAMVIAATGGACSQDGTNGMPDGGGGGGGGGGGDQPFVRVTAPEAGARIERTEAQSDGAMAAPLVFTAEASEGIDSVEWIAEDTLVLGVGQAPEFRLSMPFRNDGDRWVTARARDAAGMVVATSRVDFVVAPPKVNPAMTCQQQLTALGITWKVASAHKGVSDPVDITLPLNGIRYYAYGASSPQTTLFMDCKLAVALHKMAEVLKPKGIVAVEHIGIYNYRCIGGGNPDTDNCTPSMHAQALGIDLHEFRDANGGTYNTETDFVIDPAPQKTCTAATSNAKDALLHELACSFFTQDVFNIILTPNYNADHRNHYHVDLTPGGNFIGATSPDARGTDPLYSLPDD